MTELVEWIGETVPREVEVTFVDKRGENGARATPLDRGLPGQRSRAQVGVHRHRSAVPPPEA
jgi:hypothetical protein